MMKIGSDYFVIFLLNTLVFLLILIQPTFALTSLANYVTALANYVTA
jgi:hypothetical protein